MRFNEPKLGCRLMSSAYNQLLEAAIQHLQDLKARGVRFVPLSSKNLAGLSRKLRISLTPVSPPAEGPLVKPTPSVPKTSHEAPVVEPSLKVPLPDSDAKIAAFTDLRHRALACIKCPNLVAARKHIVFGVGSLEAQLMFIGEAPGADEDAQGEPFVGKAGQLLTRIIEAMGLTRDSVYIANILKCRPDTPGQTAGNRKPTPEEMQTCIPYLHEQIDLIGPKVIVALGGTAMEGLLGKTGITKLRGHWHTYRGIPLMPSYHPAYLLRNQSPIEKRRVWEDMLQVMEKLGLPISQRQRGFFSKTG